MAIEFQVTFDSPDPDKLATFWAAALDYIVQPAPAGFADWPAFLAANGIEVEPNSASALVDPQGRGPRIFIQKVPEPKTAKNRVHLDINVSDARTVGAEAGPQRVAAHVERLVALGASVVEQRSARGETWTVLRDLDGNEFCIQ